MYAYIVLSPDRTLIIRGSHTVEAYNGSPIEGDAVDPMEFELDCAEYGAERGAVMIVDEWLRNRDGDELAEYFAVRPLTGERLWAVQTREAVRDEHTGEFECWNVTSVSYKHAARPEELAKGYELSNMANEGDKREYWLVEQPDADKQVEIFEIA